MIRENTEGEYGNVGGRMFEGTEREVVTQQSVFSRKGVDRIMKYAFELAQDAQEARHLLHQVERHLDHHALLGRALRRDEEEVPGSVRTDQYHVDGLSIQMVLNPDRFDVIVASNLFGDILSDLGPATAGTIGIAPSGNINPERTAPSHLRAGARLGAGHRREEDRQPDRPDLVGRADARAPRPSAAAAPTSCARSSA